MKVKALKTFTTDISMKEGETREVPDDRGRYFNSVGLTKEVKPEHKKKDAKPAKKQDASAKHRDTKEDKTDKEDK